MVIGLAVVHALGDAASYNWIYLPLVLIAFGLIASLIGIFVVRLKDDNSDVIKSMNVGYYLTVVLVVVFLFLATYMVLGQSEGIDNWYMFAGAGLVGIILGLAIVFITQYYTGDHKPVKSIAESSETGPATNVIQGISIGMESTVLPPRAPTPPPSDSTEPPSEPSPCWDPPRSSSPWTPSDPSPTTEAESPR